MSEKIVILPLDERPCNYNFSYMLGKETEFDIIRPKVSILGDKKSPGDIAAIHSWLLEETKDAYGVILSIDTLLYGGIVPSRLHYYTIEELEQSLNIIEKIRENNEDIKIFVFNLIMRNPTYSSADEEPDYYGEWGREIFLKGNLIHRKELDIATKEELQQLEEVEEKLPNEYFQDYISRREINTEINLKVIDKVKSGVIDFMIVPQDDASPYGLTAKDQKKVRKYISEKNVALKVYMYPDADAVANTLLVRMINAFKNLRPLIYVKYASTLAPSIIPSFEDRLLNETIKYQILAAGCLVTSCQSESDIVLLVNAPGGKMLGCTQFNEKSIEYDAFRTLIEIVEYADYIINVVKKPCVIADVAFSNGSDQELIQLMTAKGILFDVAGYAGWNTSSNTLGTCIPQGIIYHIYGKTKSHIDFLGLRYVEDAGYCARIKSLVCEKYLPKYNYTYFNVEETQGVIAKYVNEELNNYISENLKDKDYEIVIKDCYMPWRRMFEVGLKVEVNRRV